MKVYHKNGVTIVETDHFPRQSNTGHLGIHKNKSGYYQVSIGTKQLGIRKSLEDAISLRCEALRHIADNSFEQWRASIRK